MALLSTTIGEMDAIAIVRATIWVAIALFHGLAQRRWTATLGATPQMRTFPMDVIARVSLDGLNPIAAMERDAMHRRIATGMGLPTSSTTETDALVSAMLGMMGSSATSSQRTLLFAVSLRVQMQSAM